MEDFDIMNIEELSLTHAYLILQWGDQTMRVPPDGEIEVDGERVGTVTE